MLLAFVESIVAARPKVIMHIVVDHLGRANIGYHNSVRSDAGEVVTRTSTAWLMQGFSWTGCMQKKNVLHLVHLC